jgi:VWFA-related protein
MKTALGSFPLVASILLSAALVRAQDAAPPPQDSGLIIRQSVQEVLLEVTVRDSHGKVVKNLKPADLEVLENGVKQEIRSFKLIQAHETEGKGKGKGAAEQQIVATPVAPGTKPLKTTNLICIVFANLDAFSSLKENAINSVKDFLRSQIQPDTWIAVFNLGSELTVLQPFTTNRNEVMQAANRAFVGMGGDFAQAATAVLDASPTASSIEAAVNGTAATGNTVTASMKLTGVSLTPQASAPAAMANNTATSRDQAIQRRQLNGVEGMREMEQLLAMIRQLGTLPGRKSVLMLSPGLVTVDDPEQFKSMLDKAVKADVTIYAVDVNGLSSLDPSKASSDALKSAVKASNNQSSTSASGMQGRMHQGDTVVDAVRTTDTQAALRGLSEGTGGFLIGGTNDLRKSYQRLLDDVDTHYEVIYRPTSDKYDGSLRTIALKAAHNDWNLESRTGYFALPSFGTATELTPVELAGLAALNVKQPPHAFEFKSGAYQFRPSAANSQNDVVFEIPAGNLQATPEPALKRSRIHVSLLGLVKDASGQVVDKFSQDSPFEIPDENLAKARSLNITLTHPLTLPPGHYSVDIAVLDREAGRASISKVAFDSPEQKGVGLSSVLLLQNKEPVSGKVAPADPLEFQLDATTGERMLPELGTNLPPTATPSVFFVVYPDKAIADKPKIQAEFLLGGKLLGKQVADLPAPDATGAILMQISAPAKQGDCELRITALQGATSSVQSIKYSVAAK